MRYEQPEVVVVTHKPMNDGWCAIAGAPLAPYCRGVQEPWHYVYSMTVSTRSEAVDIADSWSQYIGCPLSDVSDDPQSEESVLSGFMAQGPNIAVSQEVF